MELRATCPKHPNCKRFFTTAHIMQEWLVNDEGDWIETYRDLEVTHGPDPDNNWYCYECGRIVKVERK